MIKDIIFILGILCIIRYIYSNFFKSKNILLKTNNTKLNYQKTYIKKSFMTNCEKEFYNKLKDLNNDYLVIPQVNLATIINKKSKSLYQNELFKNIDFGIFDKNTMEILLLIELNDKTHNTYKRKQRDFNVKKICKSANIPLITFYTSYPNEKDYVIKRIRENICYKD